MRLVPFCMLLVVFGLLVPSPFPPRAAQECRTFEIVKGVGAKFCFDPATKDGYLEVLGNKVARLVARPGYHEMKAVLGPEIREANFRAQHQIRFQLNSTGPYRNRLIMELCGWDPTFIKWGRWGKERCSAWINLGHINYAAAIGADLQNGVACNRDTDCRSGYCYLGPGHDGAHYCLDRARNCAAPKSDGYMYGNTVLVGAQSWQCYRPPAGKATWRLTGR